MNANQLLEAMENGAIVTFRMVRRSSMSNGHRKMVVQYPDGSTEIIQHSTLKPLIRDDKVWYIPRVWGAEYRLAAEKYKQVIE